MDTIRENKTNVSEMWLCQLGSIIDVCIPTRDKTKVPAEVIKAIKNLPIMTTILYSEVTGLGPARNDLMRRVTTPFFIFIDDDVIVNNEWFHKVVEKIDDKTGAVCGFGLPESFLVGSLRKAVMTIRGDKQQRGFTSNTVIRAESVKGVELKSMGRLEDMELQRAIEANGYEWRFAKAYCAHLKSSRQVMREAWGDFKTLVQREGFIKALMRL